eukprot:gene4259-4680_t
MTALSYDLLVQLACLFNTVEGIELGASAKAANWMGEPFSHLDGLVDACTLMDFLSRRLEECMFVIDRANIHQALPYYLCLHKMAIALPFFDLQHHNQGHLVSIFSKQVEQTLALHRNCVATSAALALLSATAPTTAVAAPRALLSPLFIATTEVSGISRKVVDLIIPASPYTTSVNEKAKPQATQCPIPAISEPPGSVSQQKDEEEIVHVLWGPLQVPRAIKAEHYHASVLHLIERFDKAQEEVEQRRIRAIWQIHRLKRMKVAREQIRELYDDVQAFLTIPKPISQGDRPQQVTEKHEWYNEGNMLNEGQKNSDIGEGLQNLDLVAITDGRQVIDTEEDKQEIATASKDLIDDNRSFSPLGVFPKEQPFTAVVRNDDAINKTEPRDKGHKVEQEDREDIVKGFVAENREVTKRNEVKLGKVLEQNEEIAMRTSAAMEMFRNNARIAQSILSCDLVLNLLLCGIDIKILRLSEDYLSSFLQALQGLGGNEVKHILSGKDGIAVVLKSCITWTESCRLAYPRFVERVPKEAFRKEVCLLRRRAWQAAWSSLFSVPDCQPYILRQLFLHFDSISSLQERTRRIGESLFEDCLQWKTRRMVSPSLSLAGNFSHDKNYEQSYGGEKNFFFWQLERIQVIGSNTPKLVFSISNNQGGPPPLFWWEKPFSSYGVQRVKLHSLSEPLVQSVNYIFGENWLDHLRPFFHCSLHVMQLHSLHTLLHRLLLSKEKQISHGRESLCQPWFLLYKVGGIVRALAVYFSRQYEQAHLRLMLVVKTLVHFDSVKEINRLADAIRSFETELREASLTSVEDTLFDLVIKGNNSNSLNGSMKLQAALRKCLSTCSTAMAFIFRLCVIDRCPTIASSDDEAAFCQHCQLVTECREELLYQCQSIHDLHMVHYARDLLQCLKNG